LKSILIFDHVQTTKYSGEGKKTKKRHYLRGKMVANGC